MSKRSSTARARTRVRRPPAPRAGLRASRTRHRGAAGAALSLPEECTLSDAASLKVRLAALLATEDSVTIDVSGVRRIDTASLQLLAAFTRDRRASRLAVDVRGESSAFGEAVRLTGLGRLFDIAPRVHPL
jgi:ABC-type transporter Mla MlaB component